jgi:hypothetical protein
MPVIFERVLMIDRGGFIIYKQKLDTVAMEESLVYINKLWSPPLLKLPGPYTQRICVDRYWSVTSSETERINHSAAIKFAFYTHRRHQSVIFSLNAAPRRRRKAKMSREKIKSQALELAERWKNLIGTNDIETKADLARYLGVSRARVTKVLRRLPL